MVTSCLRSAASREDLLIVLLSYEPFKYCVHLVNVQRDRGLRILRVESPIGIGIAIAFHAVNLIVGPAIHAQRFDLRDVGAQFAM